MTKSYSKFVVAYYRRHHRQHIFNEKVVSLCVIWSAKSHSEPVVTACPGIPADIEKYYVRQAARYKTDMRADIAKIKLTIDQ